MNKSKVFRNIYLTKTVKGVMEFSTVCRLEQLFEINATTLTAVQNDTRI